MLDLLMKVNKFQCEKAKPKIQILSTLFLNGPQLQLRERNFMTTGK